MTSHEVAADVTHAVATPRPLLRFIITLLALLAFAGFVSLGIWQLQRREWKLALIERVEQRVHAVPVQAPGPALWADLNTANAEYRHVSVTGHFLHERETAVQAATALGSGYWVMTPLQTTEGMLVLINRGFVPMQLRDAASRPAGQIAGEVTITGLLRITEPAGTLLRDNQVADNRWYSRDVQVIATARGLPVRQVAPYFIDADTPAAAAARNPQSPVAGLTVLSFHNNHLSYAITWFCLALLPVAFVLITIRIERRLI